MLKIKDLTVGSTCEVTLVVKSATARETRAKKPYLALEFYDGIDTINGNYWDWTSGNIPAVNSILDITGSVTEWQHNKQLTVRTLKVNNTYTLNEFIPSSTHDLSDVYKEAYNTLLTVKDDDLRTLALDIFEELRTLWLEVPGAVSVHHNFIGGTLVHSYETVQYAKVLAEHTPEANVDLCIVGAMLHDLGKLFTYKLNGISIDMTDEGLLYEHSFIGAEFVGNFAESHLDVDNPVVERKVQLLRHIILSHHGQLQYGAAVLPQCIEAFIVSAADGISASIEQVRVATRKAENKQWTDRVYTLGNKAMLTPDYVANVFMS